MISLKYKIKIIEPFFEPLPDELKSIRKEDEIYEDIKIVKDKVRTLLEKYPCIDISVSELNFIMTADEVMQSKCYHCSHMKRWKYPYSTCMNRKIDGRDVVKFMNGNMCLYFDMR